MTLFPVGLVFLGLFLVGRLRGLKQGLMLATALLPFGALAVASIGNFNFLLYHMAFMILIAWAIGQHLFSRERLTLPKPELPVLIFLVLTLYAVFSAFALPRFFAGEVYVFSLDANSPGHRISVWFPSRLSRLQPSSGNISQSIYFVLSFLALLFCVSVMRRRGADFLNGAIFMAAGANIVLGLMDLVGLDAVLLQLKTAGYSIFEDVRILNLQRNVGGFAEGSSMGGFAAVLAAYTLSRYLDTGRKLPLFLGISNLGLCLMSLSSTGFFAAAILGAYLIIRSIRQNLSMQIRASRSLRIAFWVVLGGSSIVLLFMFTDVGAAILPFIDYLVLSKSESLSGLERSAWARRGLELGVETFGLGAGLGSTRSNGLISVLIGNVGYIGLMLFVLLIYVLLKKPKIPFRSIEHQFLHNAASAALITLLAARLVSGTTANPGILFALIAAIAIASKPPVFVKVSGLRFSALPEVNTPGLQGARPNAG